ncbi:unknown [[Mannheimia] succiniciproducens MBEL55E]|uniref:Uncharacterized protein n=1 Tax=Mannheimia succiniciproducens (strain KCTC 0769BP / MBEL55E) TaxID=221988 RepID=Q65WL1_MANSM|nr:unknown [[Mannheimia] succiniciproducens MBEL55E]
MTALYNFIQAIRLKSAVILWIILLKPYYVYTKYRNWALRQFSNYWHNILQNN